MNKKKTTKKEIADTKKEIKDLKAEVKDKEESKEIKCDHKALIANMGSGASVYCPICRQMVYRD